MDDIYRAVATPEQKARLLREWYGPEFSIKGFEVKGAETGELAAILKESPEKRKPIMEYLEHQINSLIQKKLTGFTTLHDAPSKQTTSSSSSSQTPQSKKARKQTT
jgi:pumilio family protein 6